MGEWPVRASTSFIRGIRVLLKDKAFSAPQKERYETVNDFKPVSKKSLPAWKVLIAVLSLSFPARRCRKLHSNLARSCL